MISIITAVHNQIRFNQLFIESLKKNSFYKNEIIIIDNHSTDGSPEFFEEHGCIVMRNSNNRCYPASQNMGISISHRPYLAFLNNDIYLGPNWDRNIIEAMQSGKLDIASLGSVEVTENPIERRKYSQRWKWIRRGKRHLHAEVPALKSMMFRLYGNGFEQWCYTRHKIYYPKTYPGTTGSAVVTTKELWNKLGELWDERVESSDWDIHIRASKRASEVGDIKPPVIVPWALHHHFSRVTFHSKPEPCACNHPHIKLSDKWSDEEIKRYGPWLPEDLSWRATIRKFIKRFRVDLNPIDREAVTQRSKKN